MIDALKIGYRTYRLETIDSSAEADNGRTAHVNHRTGVIRLANDQPPARTAFLIVHEALHAMFEDTGIQWEAADEEKMVERLTPRLCALLADNPDGVREIVRVLAGEDG